ncbi:MAG: hypothetical protein DRQ46_00565 [Gammaproteobacteria bacterium]|nr:MAG: hypothetical protein DRQ46_00565 [Gammaproteobacteria bacterium]
MSHINQLKKIVDKFVEDAKEQPRTPIMSIARAMERRLAERKAEYMQWKNESVSALFAGIEKELSNATGDARFLAKKVVKQKAVRIANFAMMIYNNAGKQVGK